MFVVVKSINHSRYKAISKPYFYMTDAEAALERIKSRVRGIVRDVDDRSFVCFQDNIPIFYKVVKDHQSL